MKAVLPSMLGVFDNCDDSSGNIGGSIDNTIELLEIIATSNVESITIKQTVFNYLQNELKDTDYFDYGQFGYHLFSVFKNPAVQLNKDVDFLSFTNGKITQLTGLQDNYRKEFLPKGNNRFFASNRQN